jgi:phenylpyruvate tautomerase PptA (4-oxalocrotonate tautomerase family)
MPVVHIKGHPIDDQRQIEGAMTSLAESLSTATGCRHENVWCTFTNVTAATVGPTVPRSEDRIVYADLLMRPRGSETAARALEATASTISRSLGVPLENVWVRLAELTSGSVFGGGELMA